MSEYSILEKFTTHLKQALIKAHDFAREFGHEDVTPAHLLYGLAAQRGSLSYELLKKTQFPVDLLKQELVRKHYTPYTSEPDDPQMDDACIDLLTKAIRTAQIHEHTYIGTEHILLCLLQPDQESILELFSDWQIPIGEIRHQVLVVLKSTSKFPDLSQTIKYLQTNEEEPESEYSEFPVLQSVAKELTTPAILQSISPLIGRDEQIQRSLQILGRKDKNNPLLVGKPGVGKTAIVEGLAQLIVSGQAKGFLQNKRIFSLELGSMVAGTMYRGEFEQRMKSVLDEIAANPDIILFIDEIHTLVGAGSTGQPLDAANMLKPALARGDIRCIGATTWDEYQAHLKNDKALSRRFQLVQVPEPSKEETADILKGVKKTYEAFHEVSITKQALETALDLSERFLTHTAWPDKALDLIDEAASHITMQREPSEAEKRKNRLRKQLTSIEEKKATYLHEENFDQAFSAHKKAQQLLEQLQDIDVEKKTLPRITHKHVELAISKRTGLPTSRLTASATLGKNLYKHLTQEVVGQNQAIKKLTKNIERAYSPLKDPEKPLGAYLLLGPSGVGKTTTARSIAKHLFGSEKHLLKIDMSEYTEKHTLSKLIGAPAGYVGYQKSGLLTQAIEEQPLSVILFDEIEKAHPDLFNILLQILDDGVLRDGSGKELDFRHSLILLTSNLGIDHLYSSLGFGSKEEEQVSHLISSAKSFFRQELLHRLDDIIVYDHLGKPEREAIIKQKVQELDNRLGNLAQLSISPNAIAHLEAQGYKKKEGVRSLHKIVREEIEHLLIHKLPKTKKGTTISIDVHENEIVLS